MALAFPQTKLDIKVEIALSADLTDVNLNWSWTDATAYFLVASLIVITRGRGDEFSTAAPATCRLTVINTDGRWCRTNPTGAWYGQLSKNTPLRVRVNGGSGYVTRFTGFIDELPPRWDKSGRFAHVPITASGVLRRIKQGGAFRSALYRAHTDGYFSTGAPVAYWPCEDESGSTSIASGIGGPAMAYAGDNFALASDSTIAGSDPLPVLGENGYLVGTVPTYTSSTSWAVRFLMKIPTGDAGVLLFWDTPSGTGNVTWRLSLDSGTDLVHIAAYNSAGTDVIADAGATVTGIRDKQIYIEINAVQNGTGIDWDYTALLPSGTGTGKVGTLASSTVGNVTRAIVFAGVAALGNSTIGHIAVSTDTGYGAGFYGANGFVGESTWFRFQRLLAEENIAWNAFDNLDLPVSLMGQQFKTSLAGQLGEIEATEAAPVFDGTDGAVWITARQNRYNAAVGLTLDFDASQVAEPPEPTDDDQQLHNDITVSRPGGSSARATQATGPNSTAIGVYSLAETVNSQADAVLLNYAQWLRHLGTVDDLRFPRLDFNFARATSKILDWLACDINSRIQLTNPPSQLAPDTIDLFLEGYTETLGPYTWQVAANCSPALPWSTFTVEGSGNLGRIGAGGSYLLTGATAGATSLLVATQNAGPLWSTTAEPYDWAIAGERVTATAVTSNVAAFVNTATAAHADNASVTPTMPASVQQGDLLLVFAAIRTTSGTVSTPTGYTQLLSMGGHVKLFGKIHTGTESAPTVSFTGGAAGDTTSAVMAAFRNTQCVVQTSAQQTNGSAQNISVPGLPGVDRPGLLVLWLGWKQDDWTSVATIAGGFATEIGEPSSTTGNDQGLVWDYLISGNPAEPGTATFTVTGGANAVSKGAVVSLLADVQTVTATRAVNGVSKAQSANAAVSLWKPGVLAL